MYACILSGLEDQCGGALNAGQAASGSGAYLRAAPEAEVQKHLHSFFHVGNESAMSLDEAAGKQHHLRIEHGVLAFTSFKARISPAGSGSFRRSRLLRASRKFPRPRTAFSPAFRAIAGS
jgi:hypothetical protein